MMSKINIKLMSEEAYATLKKNIDNYVNQFQNSPEDSSWIDSIIADKVFEIKKYQIEDFELKVPENYKDKNVDLENGIILFEHLNTLPGYILSEPRFWLWIMFEKGYETALKGMEKNDAQAFKHQWLFTDGLRRGLFFNVLSRLYYRVELTYAPENKEDPYYLSRCVMENPLRFRELTWRTISNYRFVVKAMLKAEIRVNNELHFEEKGDYFKILAKEISKLGSIKLIDAMEESEIEDCIYEKYLKIVSDAIEKDKTDKLNKAIDLANENDEKSLNKAIEILNELGDFMNSQELLDSAQNKLNDLKVNKIFAFFKKKS